jgi:2'-5' RNA ligase
MPTIGVAIAVPEPFGEELRAHRSSFGDPQAAAIPTHVTLLPPTEVDDTELTDVEEQLERVADKHDPFDMHLRGTATFRPVSPVVFVVVAQGISECEMLAESIRAELGGADPRFPYHPHVTVAHDVPEEALDLAYDTLGTYEARFSVATFALYVHDEASGWVCERELALRGGAAQPCR